MKEIPLTQGKVALVDDGEFEELNKYKWHVLWNGYSFYAVRSVGKKTISMHRQIMGTPKGMDTDHRDMNTLNNQRFNLRICTGSQNMYNSGKRKNNTSGYKGVTFNKKKRKFQAQIRVPGKRFYLGLFTTPIKAAIAYDIAAKRLHGVFAQLNFNK
jgi:hypothetical protein